MSPMRCRTSIVETFSVISASLATIIVARNVVGNVHGMQGCLHGHSLRVLSSNSIDAEAQSSKRLRCPEDPVLREKVINDRPLLSIDPTGD
jgi:hypothetical protein